MWPMFVIVVRNSRCYIFTCILYVKIVLDCCIEMIISFGWSSLSSFFSFSFFSHFLFPKDFRVLFIRWWYVRGCLVFVFLSPITLFPSSITQNIWVPWLRSLFDFCFQFLFPSLNSLICEWWVMETENTF